MPKKVKPTGVLLDKSSLSVHHVAAGKGGRYALDAVKVEADGTTAATDARVVLAVEPSAEKAEDFPSVGEPAQLPEGGVLVALDVARDVIKHISKPLPKPILNHAIVTEADHSAERDHVELTTTDLRRTRREAADVEGSFPPWQDMIAGVPEKRKAVVSLGVRALEELVKALKSIQTALPMCDGTDAAITLEVTGPDKPVLVHGTVQGQRRFIGVISHVRNPQATEYNAWQRALLGK